jgi:hypothetical protein
VAADDFGVNFEERFADFLRELEIFFLVVLSGMNATLAFSEAKFTFTLSTPETFFSLFSIFAAQDAQCIPEILIDVF